MQKALVTGANGHIGSNVARELATHGYDVVALVRPGADLRSLQGIALEERRGDVLDEASVARAVEGCTQVFHVAAPYVLWATDPESIVKAAVAGTENVLRAAARAAVKRVVVTGSCNAVGFSTNRPLDERTWRSKASSPYMRAKLEQERRALALGDELGMEVVTVLPTAVLGPGDYRKTPTSGPFVDAVRGKGPVPFAMNVVDVRDVARGQRLAMEKGRAGERYLLGGDNVDPDDLAGLVEAHVGKRPSTKLPPEWALRAVAALAETVSAISKKPPMITRAILDDVAGGAPIFDIGKAKRELGYEPRPAEEVVAATIEWARRMKWID